jgi:hypothetical protein
VGPEDCFAGGKIPVDFYQMATSGASVEGSKATKKKTAELGEEIKKIVLTFLGFAVGDIPSQ